MQDWLKRLLSDGSEPSMTRALSAICVLTGCAVAVYSVGAGSNLSEAAILIGSLLVPAFGAKVVQRHTEGKE